jgi:hypothetical protein
VPLATLWITCPGQGGLLELQGEKGQVMTLLYRVTTLITGTYVQGGGIQQFHFRSGGTAAQKCAAVAAFWNYNPTIFATGTTFAVQQEIEVLEDTTGVIDTVVTGAASTIVGTGGTAALSPATQGLIRWRTGVYEDGKELRGRTFLPGMVEAGNDLGVPNSGTLSAIATMASGLVSEANTELAIWRRPRVARPQVGSPGDRWYLRAQSARPGSSAVVASSSAWDKWATLRSRRD